MAGDWIKVDCALPDKPEIFALADALGLGMDEILGKVIRLWIWFDRHSRSGDALRVTRVTVDRVTGYVGFAEACERVGWLRVTDDGISLPNAERHSEKTAKDRALAAERMRRYRERNKAVTVTVTALPEKRREEKKQEKKKALCASRIPDNWEPPPEVCEWFRQTRPELSLSETVADFRDYWESRSGANAAKLDWVKTFRNWTRRARSYGNASTGKRRISLADQAAARHRDGI